MTDIADSPKVLFIGQVPETVDFADPALPPGTTTAKIHAGIETAMKQMSDRGWQAELCLVQPDASADVEVRRRLAARAFDCVVIGGGLRIPPKSLLLFEELINAVHAAAPRASIAFNSMPTDTADAAARWLKTH